MNRRILLMMLVLLSFSKVFATGEPSTYFQIYVPPNNDAVRRDAALIVTAIYDSTSFQIIDDGADGDTDDSKSGMLMAGQSYVLYIRDNGINDDARYASGGVLKWDGDYFVVKSDKLVYASQSTNSDWQHDWVPSTDKRSIGLKFLVYSPPYSSSKRDINVFAYQNNTTVTFQKISVTPKTTTGFTDVNMENPVTVFSRTINIGEDIIYKYPDGRDVMEAGETYMLVADKPITVQYGALYGNERDGGGYVPSSNGSSSGALLYFAVPYQSAGEQEIRIVSWDADNSISLERYNNGSWVSVRNYTLAKMQAGDWVGKNNSNTSYPTVFRATCTGGKRVSVFEGNWFETGSPGTSDMATMVSAENGTSSGLKFLSYIAPPGNEQNVVNPFTGQAFGQQMSHLYIFAKDGATVTVKDAYSNGTKFNKTFSIAAERYVDCALTLTDWKNIYNGTGTSSGPERPYLLVESNQPVSVMNANFNDNWMCYVGSSLEQSFTQNANVSQSSTIPADTVVVTSVINTGSVVNNPNIQVVVQDGLTVVQSTLTANNTTTEGDINKLPNKTVVVFDSLPVIPSQSQYTVQTQVVATVGNNSGTLLNGNLGTTVETIVTGNVNGQLQQSSATQVVNVNTNNTSKLLFSRYSDNVVTKDSTDSWTASWVDINKDGYDDLFVTDRRSSKPNLIYMNDKAGGFTRGQSLAADSAISMTNTWADVDNDGYTDLLVLNNTRKPNTFYHNNNGTLVKDNSQAFTQTVAYYHGGSFTDFDNDGKVDVFMCNYFPTKYNELYRNNGNNSFVKEQTSVIPSEANQSVGATWADYDGDGFMDLFVPNGNGFKNSLFHNDGNGTFSKPQNAVNAEGGQSVGSCWGDYDNDGDLDLFVTNSNAQGNFLYRNDGNAGFTKITTGAVVTEKIASHGCSFADIDNDGDLDLYITSDKSFKYLYMNNGDGTFTKKTDEVICFNIGNTYGHAWSDFDHDGDLDLFTPTHSGQLNNLFINNGNGNNWIEISLTGTISNKSAIGADVFVYSNGHVQFREVNSQSGFGGMSSLTQHFGLCSATKIDSVKVKWPSGVVQLIENPAVNQVLNIIETASVKVTGAVYFDNNNNGVHDAGEALVARAAVGLTPGSTRVYSNNNGYFAVNLGVGVYSFALLADKGLVPASTTPAMCIISNTQNPVDTVWLAAVATCNGTDAAVIMGSTAIRKGYTNNQFTMVVTNNGRIGSNSFPLKFKAPATVITGTTTPAFAIVENSVENNISYKTYTWNINNLNPFESRVISFNHGTDATVSIADTIRMTGWVEGLNADCNLADNSVTQTYKVVGAIDPNDIQVAPVGYGALGYILPSQELTYTIHFENKGTHAAEAITITDMLPEGLDMNSLHVIAQSHPGLNTQVKGNQVVFSYDNIFLPDSSSDAEGNKGYIIFAIRPVVGIAAGTMLKNKAAIRFDHYEPVETNEVINTIQSKRQEQQMINVKVYPNPAADVIYVSLDHRMGAVFTGKSVQSADLLDMTGRLLMHSTFGNNKEIRFDVPQYLQGFCFVKITDSEGYVYTKKIMIKKN